MLRSPAGYMEGYYTFVRPDGEQFEVEVPRFHFTAPFMPPPLMAFSPEDEEDEPGEMN